MTDPTLAEIMERVKAWPVGRTLSREDLTALVTEIERQASEIERLLAESKADFNACEDQLAVKDAEIERLREYWEASQAVQHGIIDFDLHGAAVERLEAATKAVRLHDLTRPIPAALKEKEPDAD